MICKKHSYLSIHEVLYHKSQGKIKRRCKYCERERHKRYRTNNKEKIKMQRKKNKENINKSRRKSLLNLSKSYIKDQLRNKILSIKYKDIPDSLVEAKRAVILLNRKIKEVKGEN